MISSSSRSTKEVDLITAEVNQLLDISPDPSLLVSNSSLEILAVNASLVEFSGYTRGELLATPLETLLPGIQEICQDENSNLELHSLQGCKLELVNRRKGKASVQVRANALGNQRRYAVYRLSSLTNSSSDMGLPVPNAAQYAGLLELLEIFNQSTLEEALDIIVRVGKDMLPAESFGIYKIDSNHPQLKAVILDNPSGFLPQTISTADFFSHYKESQFSPP